MVNFICIKNEWAFLFIFIMIGQNGIFYSKVECIPSIVVVASGGGLKEKVILGNSC